MKAIGVTHHLPVTNPSCLIDLEIPVPRPGPRDLLVRVQAVSVNPIDTKLRARQHLKKEVPIVLGYDASGMVEAIGEKVTQFQVGDAIYYAGSILRPGSNAQFQLVDERIVGHKPASLSWESAASIPLILLTAWEGLFHCLCISQRHAGSSLLILGTGAVGSMVIQLAKMSNLRIIATMSSSKSEEQCKKFGAECTVNYHYPILHKLRQMGWQEVNFIFSTVATSAYWPVMAEMIAPFGSICCIEDAVAPIDLNLLKRKSVRFAWVFVFTRSLYEHCNRGEQGKILDQAAELLNLGVLYPMVGEVLSPICAQTLREAHAKVESGGTAAGKIVLTGWS